VLIYKQVAQQRALRNTTDKGMWCESKTKVGGFALQEVDCPLMVSLVISLCTRGLVFHFVL